MKFLITGDLHIGTERPENRIDDYWKTVIGKFQFINDLALGEGVDRVLAPGDVLDSPSLSYEAFSEVASILYMSSTFWTVIHGQHSLKYRREANTALNALCCSLPNINFAPEENCDIAIKGADFGKSIPEPTQGKYNVLLIHRMVIEDKLWEQQTDYVSATNLLRKTKGYNLIVSGDNHESFYCQQKDRFLFNLGSMTRKTVGQLNHKPFVVIFDTETLEHKKVYIPIQPSEKVFDLNKIEQEKKQEKVMSVYIKGLSEQKELGLDVMNNLLNYMEKEQTEERIVNLIKGYAECKR